VAVRGFPAPWRRLPAPAGDPDAALLARVRAGEEAAFMELVRRHDAALLRLARSYGQARLELACEHALAAGVMSSRYVERLLKADRQRPFLDGGAEQSLGEHANLRGPAYYN